MIWMLLLGVATGNRCMTPIAVVCWFCWLNRFPVKHTWAFWAGNIIAAIVFTLFALGEYAGDTLPRTPNRTAPGPAISRTVFGALVGAIAATASTQPVAGGVLFGLIGAVIGTWGGFYARRYLSQKIGRDLPVALAESALTLAIAYYAAHWITIGIIKYPTYYSLLSVPHLR